MIVPKANRWECLNKKGSPDHGFGLADYVAVRSGRANIPLFGPKSAPGPLPKLQFPKEIQCLASLRNRIKDS